MKSTNILIVIALLLSLTACNAQIKNPITENVKIYGNCGMCERTIEKAGNIKKIAKVDWNKDTKIATLTYDTSKINQDEILKRIALVGYDSEKFLAPDDVYANLPECCQYDREKKTKTMKAENTVEGYSIHNHDEILNKPTETTQDVNELKPVFDNYFALKDALVKTDKSEASLKAKDLLKAVNTVKMEKLSVDEHGVFMKVLDNLKSNIEKISTTANIEDQRKFFMNLSVSFYDLVKVSHLENPVYYQHCPMANDGKGANWLSKENNIRNPYFGSQMLTCGKTIETIK
ncbi:MAG: DUF3347 domain-containing protein [Sphingobacteriales bacterium]|nr:DUF3347 domain-containing protein [Sphingobacteriales bacterium]